VLTDTGLFKYRFGSDRNHKLSQVMAFFWINMQIQHMVDNTGGFYAMGKGFDVISFDSSVDNAYWNFAERFVLIGSSPNGNEFSLSAEVYLHEMGHANASYATNFSLHNNLATDKTIICGPEENFGICCKDATGCSGAINEGLADYHSGILFPKNTAFLETYVNNVQGINECGVTRRVDLNAELLAAESFSACPAPFRGEVHVMGRVYASIWWEVRRAAGEDFKLVDELFTEHLPLLAADDDFSTALDHIITADQALFAGKFSSDFITEFARRGISQ